MDPTFNPNYTYSGNSLTPQQRQQMQMQVNGLIPYNTPVNTPGAGVGQMANALVNGLLQNKSMQQYLNGGQQTAAPAAGSPMQLASASQQNNLSDDTATAPGLPYNPGGALPPASQATGFAPGFSVPTTPMAMPFSPPPMIDPSSGVAMPSSVAGSPQDAFSGLFGT